MLSSENVFSAINTFLKNFVFNIKKSEYTYSGLNNDLYVKGINSLFFKKDNDLLIFFYPIIY